MRAFVSLLTVTFLVSTLIGCTSTKRSYPNNSNYLDSNGYPYQEKVLIPTPEKEITPAEAAQAPAPIQPTSNVIPVGKPMDPIKPAVMPLTPPKPVVVPNDSDNSEAVSSTPDLR